MTNLAPAELKKQTFLPSMPCAAYMHEFILIDPSLFSKQRLAASLVQSPPDCRQNTFGIF